ncbi:MAG: helix-turn-helix domain-containing protein [Rikenellaceae bacterium]
MKSEGLTPSRLAEILEIQPSGISHLVSGRNKPGFDLLQKILARFPRINPDWLLLDSDQMYRADASALPPKTDGKTHHDTASQNRSDLVAPMSKSTESLSVDSSRENSPQFSRPIHDERSTPRVEASVSRHEPILGLFEDVVAEQEPTPVRNEDVSRSERSERSEEVREKLSTVSSIIDPKRPRVLRVMLFYDDNTCESFDMRDRNDK